jgi:hypothetical protein
MYQSDFTKFMDDFLKTNKDVDESRMKLRATWWDKPQDLQTQEDQDSVKVAKKAYEYFPMPKPGGKA